MSYFYSLESFYAYYLLMVLPNIIEITTYIVLYEKIPGCPYLVIFEELGKYINLSK